MKNYKDGTIVDVVNDEVHLLDGADDEALLLEWIEYCELGIRWAWDERYPPGVQP